MKTRKIIFAEKGMVLTNGTNYGEQILLEEGESEYLYYEIPEEQYREILKNKESELAE